MQIKMKLAKWLSFIDNEGRKKEIVEIVREHLGKDTDLDKLELKRRSIVGEAVVIDSEEADVEQIISTRDMDRDDEIIVPDGMIIDEFNKAPQVLLGHNHGELPVALGPVTKKTKRDVRANVKFAGTQRGQEAKELVKGGYLRTASIGFVPLSIAEKGTAEFAKLATKLTKQWPEFEAVRDKVRRIIDKSLLLEWSFVSVPANINALTAAIAKGELKLSDEWLKELAIKVTDDEVAIDLTGRDVLGIKDKPKEEPKPPEHKREVERVRYVEPLPEPRKVYVEIIEPASKAIDISEMTAKDFIDLAVDIERGKV